MATPRTSSIDSSHLTSLTVLPTDVFLLQSLILCIGRPGDYRTRRRRSMNLLNNANATGRPREELQRLHHDPGGAPAAGVDRLQESDGIPDRNPARRSSSSMVQLDLATASTTLTQKLLLLIVRFRNLFAFSSGMCIALAIQMYFYYCLRKTGPPFGLVYYETVSQCWAPGGAWSWVSGGEPGNGWY
ncbi:unnamed protein product [Amoebophrya sp. A120]|nr:unnamed protein product [Amoebophrya sp. A120]|eukprot:GSA120T00009561001.1